MLLTMISNQGVRKGHGELKAELQRLEGYQRYCD